MGQSDNCPERQCVEHAKCHWKQEELKTIAFARTSLSRSALEGFGMNDCTSHLEDRQRQREKLVVLPLDSLPQINKVTPRLPSTEGMA